MSAGLYLQIVRDRRGLSRADVADKLGVSVQTISNIENGKKEPRWSLLVGLVDVVEASLEHLRVLTQGDENTKEARRLAEVQLTSTQYAEGRHLATDPSTADIARQLAEDPEFFEALAKLATERAMQRLKTQR